MKKVEDLKKLYPKICKEWDFKKNGIEINNVSKHKDMWWICSNPKNKCGCHRWKTNIYKRIKYNYGCPYCNNKKICGHNNLAINNPELLVEWDYTKNKINPYKIYSGSRKKVWWHCRQGECNCHKWKTAINQRSGRDRTGCPFCCGQKICKHNSFAIKYPKLLNEWNYNKNVQDPCTIAPKSDKKVWWICTKNKNHEWKTTIKSRTRQNTGCPYCVGTITVKENSIFMRCPKLKPEWDFQKNKGIDPHTIGIGSTKKVWWKCSDPKIKCECHKWYMSPNYRICSIKNKCTINQCPFCKGYKLCQHNTLFAKHSELCNEEWDYNKNKLDPKEISYKSTKKVWWICSKNKNHRWISSIYARTQKSSGCPKCKMSRGELKIQKFLNKKNIKYEWQKTFNDCKYKRNLIFDFYLSDFNAIIEYDGKQHFYPIKYYGGIKKYDDIKMKDKIKNKYCVDKKIPIMRISYKQFEKIEEFINLFVDNIDKYKNYFTDSDLYKEAKIELK